jgi:hypothetical protein
MATTKKTRKEIILAIVDDCVIDLVFYDRKDDDSIGVDGIDDAVADGEITVLDMVKVFQEKLEKELGVYEGDYGHG